MPTIRVKENEPFEVALRRFKRTIEKSGLLTELRAQEGCRGQAPLQAPAQHDAPEEALLIASSSPSRSFLLVLNS